MSTDSEEQKPIVHCSECSPAPHLLGSDHPFRDICT